MKASYAAVLFMLLATGWIAATTFAAVPTIPATPPKELKPMENYTTYYYIHRVEYQTNGVSGVVRELQYIDATNIVGVAAYPKMIVVKLFSRSSMTNDWALVCPEICFKLGTNTVEYYKTEARIE